MNDLFFRIAIALLIVATIAARLICDWFHPIARKPGINWPLLLIQTVIAAAVLLQLLGWEVLPMNLEPTVGVVVRSLGLALAIFAGLGTIWPRLIRKTTWADPMVVPDKVIRHQLVLKGPYKYIRHPF